MSDWSLSVLIVGAGGAAGAMARYGLTVFAGRFGAGLPAGTLVANLIGCLLMGAVVQLAARSGWFAETGIVPGQNRLLFGVGFCGAFTTMSALVLELSALLQKDQLTLAFAYLMSTMIGCFACFYLGSYVIRSVATSSGS